MSDNEWYTPAKYIEAARAVMGSIDLDPASCALANEVVKADTYYTKENNGLELPWYGNVWLNPPYSQRLGSKFVDKLIETYDNGEIKQAIMLLSSLSGDSRYFQPCWNYLICMHRGRIHFYNGNSNKDSSRHGSLFVYIGSYEQRFTQIFSQFGTIVKKVA